MLKKAFSVTIAAYQVPSAWTITSVTQYRVPVWSYGIELPISNGESPDTQGLEHGPSGAIECRVLSWRTLTSLRLATWVAISFFAQSAHIILDKPCYSALVGNWVGS